MQKSVTFINLDPSGPLKEYAFEKLDRFDRYLDGSAIAKVVLSVEKFRHIAEISVSGDGFMINAHEETSDMYSAIDMALDKLEKQIKKNKKRFKKRRSTAARSKAYPREELSVPSSEELSLEANPQIVRTKTIDYKPMDINEAILQMRLVKDNFLVFTNSQTQQVNVLYRLKDGNYGLIEPAL
ncbi:MAG: ribosome-associated translation inhibitor RaiA [Deltaproteobacteria bacterium]|nr:ribosome-associated translation inhibitor RaiA [Deltaproteobacteria bacterium]RLB91246.1 MAG: ribosome-associated translation inhibitor RaiA [Deltaproteobacteria bacterium]RLB92706.1 MAG: ribosome-associated translation inhibitor RaiA [Deltaproteobacteria bacterium]RLC08952.1 MAG: ribosome-associated translation inhibitor RaiA [Deltaproteobacteria bacterium]